MYLSGYASIYANVALQILEAEQETWSEVVKYIKENSVDCEHWSGDTLDVPVTPQAAENAKKTFERYKAAGGKVDHIKVTNDPKKAAEVRKSEASLIDTANRNPDIANQNRTSMLCLAGINATPLETCGARYA